MTSNLEPPNISQSNDSTKIKICLNKECNSPYNSNNIDKHKNHLDDLFDVDDLVNKLHGRNIEYKQQLSTQQKKILEVVKENEEAILALRKKNAGEILQKLSTLRNLKEQFGNPLVERKDFQNYDNIFFSSNHLRNFQFLEESYNKEFIAKFYKLAEAKIFNNTESNCLKHPKERISAFNLQEKDLKDQLLCKYDDTENGTTFQVCQQQLENYSLQEKYFEKLQQIKNSIFSLRYNLDCITNKILTMVQGLIEKNYKYFQENQYEFDTLNQLQPPIPRSKYQNLVSFLKKIHKNVAINNSQQEEIRNCEGLYNQLPTYPNYFGENKIKKILNIKTQLIYLLKKTMTSNLEPPNISQSNDSTKIKICLNKECNSPYNSNNIDKHKNHLDDLFDVDDLVNKLHGRNIEYKQQLSTQQKKILEVVKENEEAILALRKKNAGEILQKLSTLRNLKEQFGNPLVERKDFQNYDNIFFSSNHLRNFQFLEESYNKEFIAKFYKLAEAKIFNNTESNCLKHPKERISAFNLQEKDLKDQLLCKYDDTENGTTFQVCQQQLENYSLQEKYFEKLQQIKNSIFSLRYNLDCITNKILTMVQGLIEKNYKYFQENQYEFDTLNQLQPPIPRSKYQNLVSFLKKIHKNVAINNSQQEEIRNCEQVLAPLQQEVQNIQKKHENFLNNLKPCKLKIIVEVKKSETTDGYHIEAEQQSTLLGLFKWLKQTFNWKYELPQIKVSVDQIRHQNYNSPEQIILKNEQYIQFDLS
ncbi:unnamed protein product [Paramecium sonneborni]|uniref:Uncharacterized protein n=1 Tax=Paramecium sonneborni TaxID=65129 RepID=A0A8S1RIP7_9CILI|nr:unnamed protein product [Paramecium sonneborni]